MNRLLILLAIVACGYCAVAQTVNGSRYSVSVQDSLSLSDPPTFIVTMRSGAGDAFQSSDSVAALGTHGVSISESVAMLDAAAESTVGSVLSRTVVDTYSTADRLARQAVHFPAISDSITLADSLARGMQHTYPESVSEAAGVADAIVAGVIHTASLSDSFHQADQVSASTSINFQDYNESATDGVGVGDSLSVSVRTAGSRKKVMVIS